MRVKDRQGIRLGPGGRIPLFFLAVLICASCTTVSTSTVKATAIMFTAATFNIGDSDGSPPTMEEVVASIENFGKPDLLFIQEAPDPEFLQELTGRLEYGYMVHGLYTAGSQYSIAILCTYPLSPPSEIRSETGTLNALISEIEFPENKTLLAGSIHLKPIEKPRDREGYVQSGIGWMAVAALRETFTRTERTAELRQIRDWAAEQKPESILLAGDFNTIRVSKTVRRMKWFYKDSTRMSKEYFGGTYEKVHLPFYPRSDYIYFRGALRSFDPWILEETPGDHFPVGAEFYIQ